MERLNKYIAQSGVCSRRDADERIRQGKVTVNLKVEKNPAVSVSPEDQVRLEGKLLDQKPLQVVAFYKPTDAICTKNDPHERRTIYDLLPPKQQHLNYVGRLDQNSEGLIILTNDGDLAQQLIHPRHKVEKEYLVTVHQAITNEALNALLRGVFTTEGKLQAKAVARVSPRRVRIILEQGVKRQIRVMLKTLGFMVRKLVRLVAIAQENYFHIGKYVYNSPHASKILKDFLNLKENKKLKKQLRAINKSITYNHKLAASFFIELEQWFLYLGKFHPLHQTFLFTHL